MLSRLRKSRNGKAGRRNKKGRSGGLSVSRYAKFGAVVRAARYAGLVKTQ
jgi:hypothetical protein